MPYVKLTYGEAVSSSEVGRTRQLEAILQGLKDNHGCKIKDNWEFSIQSAGSECAAAKFLKMYWNSGVNTFKDPDIDPDIQVRWIRYYSDRLIIRKDDNPEEFFILVFGRIPNFKIIGWIKGKDGMQEKWYTTFEEGREKAYFVPQRELHPFPIIR